MNVKKIKEGAWLTLEPEDEKIGPLKFLVLPQPIDFEIKDDEGPGEIIGKIGALIEDWNLTDGETPIPCTDGNKEKYLGGALSVKVKTTNPATSTIFALREVLIFSRRIENFLGN